MRLRRFTMPCVEIPQSGRKLTSSFIAPALNISGTMPVTLKAWSRLEALCFSRALQGTRYQMAGRQWAWKLDLEATHC